MIVTDNCKWHLYYKHVIVFAIIDKYAPRVVNYAFRVMLQIVASQMMIVSDNCKCCLYYKHFIALARIIN